MNNQAEFSSKINEKEILFFSIFSIIISLLFLAEITLAVRCVHYRSCREAITKSVNLGLMAMLTREHIVTMSRSAVRK